ESQWACERRPPSRARCLSSLASCQNSINSQIAAMSRPLRIEFPGALYHVTSRGDRREAIFDDDADRHMFLGVVGDAMNRFDACALAYCLMRNHYHFIIHTRK